MYFYILWICIYLKALPMPAACHMYNIPRIYEYKLTEIYIHCQYSKANLLAAILTIHWLIGQVA